MRKKIIDDCSGVIAITAHEDPNQREQKFIIQAKITFFLAQIFGMLEYLLRRY